MGAVSCGATAADGGTDGVHGELLLGPSADVANAGMVDGSGGACLGVDATRGSKLGQVVGNATLGVLKRNEHVYIIPVTAEGRVKGPSRQVQY